MVLANDNVEMEYMFMKLIQEYRGWSLEVNIDRTKYLCVGEKINVIYNKITKRSPHAQNTNT